MPAHLLQDRGTPQRFARPRPTLLDFESSSQEAAGKSSRRSIPTWQTYLVIYFSPIIAICLLDLMAQALGLPVFVCWVCTGKRREMLQPQFPQVPIALHPTLFLYGEFPCGTGHLLVPQRSSERCHPCQALPGRVGTGGAHRECQDSALPSSLAACFPCEPREPAYGSSQKMQGGPYDGGLGFFLHKHQ